jgi:hypothetical protein
MVFESCDYCLRTFAFRKCNLSSSLGVAMSGVYLCGTFLGLGSEPNLRRAGTAQRVDVSRGQIGNGPFGPGGNYPQRVALNSQTSLLDPGLGLGDTLHCYPNFLGQLHVIGIKILFS